MPFFRRMARRGCHNSQFKTEFGCVNLGDLVAASEFANGGTVDRDALQNAGLVRDASRPIKILGDLKGSESLTVKLDVTVERCSAPARATIEAAGGSVTELGTRRDTVRDIDRNSDDRTPKNLTKKLRRGKGASGKKG